MGGLIIGFPIVLAEQYRGGEPEPTIIGYIQHIFIGVFAGFLTCTFAAFTTTDAVFDVYLMWLSRLWGWLFN
jgi:hypothetical protein